MATSAKPPAGHYTILYFASASSYTSKDTEHLPAPVLLSKLFETLEQRYTGMKSKILESCLVTINLEYVDVPDAAGAKSEIVIKEGDEVAIIPPVPMVTVLGTLALLLAAVAPVVRTRKMLGMDQCQRI